MLKIESFITEASMHGAAFIPPMNRKAAEFKAILNALATIGEAMQTLTELGVNLDSEKIAPLLMQPISKSLIDLSKPAKKKP